MLIEKQMKYFFYHQFPLFMDLPALIIFEESYQRSNRLLKWWFGPQMIQWADNLLRVVCWKKIALKCFELSTLEGMEQRASSPASPAPKPGTAQGSRVFWNPPARSGASQISYSAVLPVSLQPLSFRHCPHSSDTDPERVTDLGLLEMRTETETDKPGL